MNLQSTLLFVYLPLNVLKWPVYQPAYLSKHYHVDKRKGGFSVCLYTCSHFSYFVIL